MSIDPTKITEADIAAQIDKIPYAKFLGIRPLLMGKELTMIMPYADDIIGNPMLKALHGGAVSAFMEVTAIVQLATENENPRFARPVGINIDFLRRGLPQDTYARAMIMRQGSRVANVQVRAWQNSFDEPITVLHGHFMLPRDS